MTLYFPNESTIRSFLSKQLEPLAQNTLLIQAIAKLFANKQMESLALLPLITPLLRHQLQWKEPEWGKTIFRLEKVLLQCARIKAKL
jgi:hypothetical protein